MRKILFYLFVSVICLSSYSKNHTVYVVVPSNVDISDENVDTGVSDSVKDNPTVGIFAMDSNGKSISGVTFEKDGTSDLGEDYKTLKINIPYDSSSEDKLKLTVGYKNPLSSKSQYVFMTSENEIDLETLEDNLDYNNPLKVISTTPYSSYDKFPGYEVTSDVKLFALPINDTTKNITQEFGLPSVDFEIIDGKIVANEDFTAKVQILASQFTQPKISAAVKLNGKKISNWEDDLEDYVKDYEDWNGVSTVQSENSITKKVGSKYNLIKPLTVENIKGGEGDVITVVSRYSSSSLRDSGDKDDIIITNYDEDGNPKSYQKGSVFVKRNGDFVRNLKGYSGQDDVVKLAGDVLVEENVTNDDGEIIETKYKVSIGPNDVLLLFEHGGEFTEDPKKTNDSYLDMQDLVVLVTFDTEEAAEHIMTFIFDEGTSISSGVAMKSSSENSKKQRLSDVSISLTENSSNKKYKINSISNSSKDNESNITSDDTVNSSEDNSSSDLDEEDSSDSDTPKDSDNDESDSEEDSDDDDDESDSESWFSGWWNWWKK